MNRPPGLIDPFDLTFPELPGALQGLKIAHLSDLHVRKPRRRFDKAAAALVNAHVDLLVLTGDYMTFVGDEPQAVKVIGRLLEAVKPRYGSFGVFGNHDSAEFRKAVEPMPVRWLNDEKVMHEDLPLEVVGFNWDRTQQPDAIAAISGKGGGETEQADDERPLKLLLSHKPTWLPTAADMSMDLMFSGHTHGGQWRLPFKRAIINSTDLPWRLSSGVLRLKDTLAVVTRGVGEVVFDFRIFCPAHIPVCTLRRGPLPGQYTNEIVNTQPW